VTVNNDASTEGDDVPALMKNDNFKHSKEERGRRTKQPAGNIKAE
jgi:hypothetical protein